MPVCRAFPTLRRNLSTLVAVSSAKMANRQFHQRYIGWGPLQCREFFRRQPEDAVVIDGRQGPCDNTGKIGNQAHPFIAVIVYRLPKIPADEAAQPQFLVEFALQAALRAFPSFDLAAGKLPVAGEVQAGTAPGGQHLAIGDDNRRRDVNCGLIEAHCQKVCRGRALIAAGSASPGNAGEAMGSERLIPKGRNRGGRRN